MAAIDIILKSVLRNQIRGLFAYFFFYIVFGCVFRLQLSAGPEVLVHIIYIHKYIHHLIDNAYLMRSFPFHYGNFCKDHGKRKVYIISASSL